MELKTCTICKKALPRSSFNKRNSSADGLQTHCRECNRERSRNYYHTNKEHHLKNIYKNREKYKNELQSIVNTIKKKGCKYCDEKEVCCMDFHHKDPSVKEENISVLIHSISRAKLLNEIKKCDVVCSNCHRKIHNGLIDGSIA